MDAGRLRENVNVATRKLGPVRRSPLRLGLETVIKAVPAMSKLLVVDANC